MSTGIDVQLSAGELTLEALAKLTTATGEVRDEIKKLIKAEYEYQQRGPLFIPIGGSATSPATGNFAIDLGGPAPQRRWELRALIVGGLLFSSTVAGTGVLYQNATNQGSNEPSLSNVEDQTATLPKVAFYSSGQVVVRFPNRLYVFIGGTPTATTVYTVGGSVLDSPDIPGKFSV